MRHKRRGRRLGRSSSHRRALFRNLASSLFLTERDDLYYEGLYQSDGKTPVNPPRYKGRVVTTLHKAKEVRPLVEKCITIAKNSLDAQRTADKMVPEAERGSSEWKAWRESSKWQEWNQAVAPAIAARRRVYKLLDDKLAVQVLFDEIAPRYENRNGGYTRVVKMANVRLGDAGVQAILELVGENDTRVTKKSEKPAFADDSGDSEPDEKPAATETDKLTKLEGIGPKIAQTLNAAGITTFAELAESNVDDLQKILDEGEGNFAGNSPESWPHQAKLASEGKWDELKVLQDELDGGKYESGDKE